MQGKQCHAVLLSCCQLLLLSCVAAASSDDTVFTPGTIPVDSDGNQINAHEGWILQIEDTYLWYGTSRKVYAEDPATGHSDWLSGSVNLFVSHDLASWRRKPAVFTAAAINTGPPAAAAALARRLRAAKGSGPYRLERPRVLYNAAHRYYVLLFHLDTVELDRQQVGWAVSPSPYGEQSAAGSSSSSSSWRVVCRKVYFCRLVNMSAWNYAQLHC
eukprot:GHRQ01020875.1.p1 GENE.GHRQ01020875.1~~GHRQ01020875.1.p1  ORF type:complete len:215 (+),score=68.35 GHRQ01020875.1:118-762(+)